MLVLLVVTRIAAGAELPTPEAIVAEAGKACESLTAPAESGRKPGFQERFDRDLRQRAWMRLALARVNLGDFDGAIEALNRINSDPRFSRISVQAMRTELTGVVPPWPDDLPRRIKELQKATLADILRKRGKFDAALEMAGEIADAQIRARLAAQTVLDRSRSLEKSDPTAALKDQVEVTELANSINDAQTVRQLHYEVCRGQIRIGPPELARILIQVFTEKMKEFEQQSPRAETVQEWLRYGELYLLTSDDANAEKCFEHARQQLARRKPGMEWKQSLPYQLMLHYRCRAYRQTGRSALIAEVLAEWEQAFANLAEPKDQSFVAPFLISREIEGDRLDQASAVIDALDEPAKSSAVESVVEEIAGPASAAQKSGFAHYVKTRLAQRDDYRLLMLTLAAELFDSAGDKNAADRSIEEAVEFSTARKRDYLPLLAGWFAEHGRFERAYNLIGALDDPKEKAQALAELAYQMSKPAKP
jgi:hypothetical protein